MTGKSRHTTSIWMAETQAPVYPALNQDAHADVCVIGAGIAGISTAYTLLHAGHSVIIVDDNTVGGGQTGRTTAHLSSALDDRYFELERLHGAKAARLAAESHMAAINRIEAIVARERIDCEFERLDGYLFVPPGASTEVLEREQQAARRAGLTDVEYGERSPFASFDSGPCLRFPNQAQFHPLKYLYKLADVITQLGGRIFGGTHVYKIQGGDSARVTTRGGYVISADAVVVATNTPVNDRFVIHTKQAPYRTYVIGAPVPMGSVEKVLAWDTLDPYHYLRTQTMGGTELVIVGGEDHKTGQLAGTEERFTRLESWMRERFPMAEAVRYRWSGQIMEPVDGLAYIGRNPMDHNNVYIATGDSGNGMTHGTIAGMLLTDLILGRKNAWAELYDPDRITPAAVADFTQENLNVVAQYADWISEGEISDPRQIAPGSGAIMRRGLNKIAVYRDEQGSLHELSAVCRHLGCIVDWNPTEKTWDCPCHGSRYEADGTVINGPAVYNLERVERAVRSG